MKLSEVREKLGETKVAVRGLGDKNESRIRGAYIQHWLTHGPKLLDALKGLLWHIEGHPDIMPNHSKSVVEAAEEVEVI